MIGKLKSRNFSLILISILSCFCNSSKKLLLPIKDGIFAKTSLENRYRGNEILIFSKEDRFVRAAGNGMIKNITEVEQYLGLITEDDYLISYGNLDSVFVKRGDKIKRGQIIGSIKKSKYDDFLMLSLYIEKNGKSITDTSILVYK